MKLSTVFNQYSRFRLDHELAHSEEILFIALLAQINWARNDDNNLLNTKVVIGNPKLVVLTRMSIKQIQRARNSLMQRGLIEFKKGTGKKHYAEYSLGRYFINLDKNLCPYDQVNDQENVQVNVQVSDQVSVQRSKSNRELEYFNKNSSNEEFCENPSQDESFLDDLNQYERQVVDTWIAVIGPFQKDWLDDLREVLKECYPSQVRNAITTIARSKAEVMKEQGFSYLKDPLLKGAFGRRGKGGTAKRNKSRVSKEDWLETFKNPAGRTITDDELESIIYKPTGSDK